MITEGTRYINASDINEIESCVIGDESVTGRPYLVTIKMVGSVKQIIVIAESAGYAIMKLRNINLGDAAPKATWTGVTAEEIDILV